MIPDLYDPILPGTTIIGAHEISYIGEGGTWTHDLLIASISLYHCALVGFAFNPSGIGGALPVHSTLPVCHSTVTWRKFCLTKGSTFQLLAFCLRKRPLLIGTTGAEEFSDFHVHWKLGPPGLYFAPPPPQCACTRFLLPAQSACTQILCPPWFLDPFYQGK